MTTDRPQKEPKRPAPDARKIDEGARRDEAETEEEKIRREQATNPALMPIGDPAGAA